MQPLSLNKEAGVPYFSRACWKISTTSVALVTGTAREATQSREWSSITFTISTTRPEESLKCVMSDCQHSFGRSAENLTNDDFGRFSGAGMIWPRRRRMRVIVEVEGALP